MVRRGDNGDEYHRRIPDAHHHVGDLPCPRLPDLPFLLGFPEYTRVVDHRAADDKGIAEVHARHRGEGIDVVAAHPDTGGIVMPYRVQEAVFRREQAGRHAWVEGER